jgi:hypothetical protein
LNLKSLAVIDDDATVRESYRHVANLARLEPQVWSSRIVNPLNRILANGLGADAALSDYQLTQSGYASFNGADLVAGLYKRNTPAVLCTRFDRAAIDTIRPLLRWIPVVLAPNELDPGSLMRSLRIAADELSGMFVSERRPWRSQVHFLYRDDVNNDAYFVELPGWSRSETLKVRLSKLPPDVAARVRDGYRTFARANLGTEDVERIYLDEWEVR